MSNVATTQNFAKNLAKAKAAAQTASNSMQYLKFTKAGEWTYGAEEVEVEEGSVWAINPHSIHMGFIAWSDNKVAGEEMRPFTDDAIVASQLPDVGAPWDTQLAFQLACMSGEDKGTQVLFKTTSKGGLKCMNEYINELMERITKNPSEEDIVAVVELDASFYKHKKYGKIYTPHFKVDSWVSMEEDDFSDTPAADTEAEEEPEEEQVEDAEVVEEKEAPRKRRRRVKKD